MRILPWKIGMIVLGALVWTNGVFASNVESLQFNLPANSSQNSPEIQMAITGVAQGDQTQILADLNTYLKAHPKAALILGTTGDSDELWDTREIGELRKNKQVVSVIAKSAYDMAAKTPKAKKIREQIKKLKELGRLKAEKKMAVLVSVIPAGNYGALVYFMSSDYLLAGASFGLVFSMNAFQAIFTKQWLQFASLGERGALLVANAVANFVGKPLDEKGSGYIGRTGRVGWTVALNVAFASVTMTLSGTLDSAWALLYFGASSSYDIWDQVLEDKIKNSDFFNKHFVNSRLAIGSVVECLALAGVGVAEVTLATVSATSALAMIFEPAIKRTIQKIKLRVAGFGRFFKQNKNYNEEKSCSSFLNLYPSFVAQ